MIKNISSNVPSHIKLLLGVYLLGIIIFTIFRIAFVFTNSAELVGVENSNSLLFQAFVMGFRFDTVVSCYLLTIPFGILSVVDFFKIKSKVPTRIAYILIFIFYTLAFLACAADIPYYKHFGSKLNSAAFQWLNSPMFVLKMIAEEFSYWGYILVLIAFIWLFVFLFKKIRMRVERSSTISFGRKGILISFILVGAFIFLGMRGRVTFKSPIRIGTAYISSYSIINNTGLNPLFTLLKTVMYDMDASNKFIHIMDEKVAMDNARKFLSIPVNADSSFSRQMNLNDTSRKVNVVIVLMESMCTYKMGDYHGKLLAHVMDSLSKRSIYFSNFYSAGIHTFNGIFSSLYSYPALFKQQPLKYNTQHKFYGIPGALKENGYQTMYFTTHDEQFDNMGGFLQYNGFDKIISEKDYPIGHSLSTLGVPDHYMFEYSMNVLDDAAKNNKPFLAVMLTTSDHGPWIIPTDIPLKPTSTDEKEKATEYADWSIGQLLKNSSSRSWFKNTVFVFLGDHGMSVSTTYDMPLSYNHIPCIFYGPGVIDSNRVIKNFGGQIDLYPTLMSFLKLPIENNTPGVDLFTEKRPCMFFCADDKVGCIDENYYYIYHNESSEEALYKYHDLSPTNYIANNKAHADSLKNYAFSMMQASQWMIKNNKFGKKNEN